MDAWGSLTAFLAEAAGDDGDDDDALPKYSGHEPSAIQHQSLVTKHAGTTVAAGVPAERVPDPASDRVKSLRAERDSIRRALLRAVNPKQKAELLKRGKEVSAELGKMNQSAMSPLSGLKKAQQRVDALNKISPGAGDPKAREFGVPTSAERTTSRLKRSVRKELDELRKDAEMAEGHLMLWSKQLERDVAQLEKEMAESDQTDLAAKRAIANQIRRKRIEHQTLAQKANDKSAAINARIKELESDPTSWEEVVNKMTPDQYFAQGKRTHTDVSLRGDPESGLADVPGSPSTRARLPQRPQEPSAGERPEWVDPAVTLPSYPPGEGTFDTEPWPKGKTPIGRKPGQFIDKATGRPMKAARDVSEPVEPQLYWDARDRLWRRKTDLLSRRASGTAPQSTGSKVSRPNELPQHMTRHRSKAGKSED